MKLECGLCRLACPAGLSPSRRAGEPSSSGAGKMTGSLTGGPSSSWAGSEGSPLAVEQDPPTGDLPVKTRAGNLIRGGEPSEKIGHFSAEGFGGGIESRTCKDRRLSARSRGPQGNLRGGMPISVMMRAGKTIKLDVEPSSTIENVLPAAGGGEARSGLWLRWVRRAMAARPAAASGCGGRGGRWRRDPQRPLAAAGAAGDGGETRSGLWLRQARRAAAGTTWTTAPAADTGGHPQHRLDTCAAGGSATEPGSCEMRLG